MHTRNTYFKEPTRRGPTPPYSPPYRKIFAKEHERSRSSPVVSHRRLAGELCCCCPAGAGTCKGNAEDQYTSDFDKGEKNSAQPEQPDWRDVVAAFENCLLSVRQSLCGGPWHLNQSRDGTALGGAHKVVPLAHVRPTAKPVATLFIVSEYGVGLNKMQVQSVPCGENICVFLVISGFVELSKWECLLDTLILCPTFCCLRSEKIGRDVLDFHAEY